MSGPLVSRRGVVALLALAAPAALTACRGEPETAAGGEPGAPRRIRMGFSQVGAESGWRIANTRSIRDAARDAAVDLHLVEGDQQQEKQIQAIRTFIADGVDVIGFSPVVEDNWDTVLREASKAGIPVILTDRTIETIEPAFITSFIGSDFWAEGRRAAEWLAAEYRDARRPADAVEIQGTPGSAPAVDRQDGFTETLSRLEAKVRLVGSRPGNFTREGGRAVMAGFLETRPDVEVVYAHNDDMALGAIEAIEDAGRTPGTDVRIVSVDGIREAMQALADGKIDYIVECNPLLGPQLMKLVRQVVAGESIPERVVTAESTFTREQAAQVLPRRRY